MTCPELSSGKVFMMKKATWFASRALVILLLSGCSGGSSAANTGGSGDGSSLTAAVQPTITTTAAQGGAVIVSIADSTSGASIHYTLDGSSPTATSPIYQAPFLVTSTTTVKAMAVASGYTNSNVASQSFSISIASGTLVWSDEFSNSTPANAQPNPAVWTYDTGGGGWGNGELEDYCGWNSGASPCDSSNPNAFVGTDGYLHIVARSPSAGVYTSARMKTQGMFSLLYGRVEARIKMPEGQGLWPAFWTLGNNIATDGWPACGEQDIMEHINQPTPDWVAGSVLAPSLNLGTNYTATASNGFSASDWHTYGMIWTKGSVEYYVDSPSNVYATYTPSSQAGGTWPFDSGNANFLILNLAVGGNWPGSPNNTTPFPAEMLVDYVRVYTN